MNNTGDKTYKLHQILRAAGSIAVAFSGGTDSAFLLHKAGEVLGDKCLAITAVLQSATADEIKDAKAFCEKKGIRHICTALDELSIEGFYANPPDRCYICKKGIFTKIKEIAAEQGISFVADGSNIDDTNDYRPGMKALKELGIKSPLMEAGLTKNEIRMLSKEANLPTWDLPSSPCLSSRIPYGEIITKEKLSMIEAGESFLKSLGFKVCRVRMHDKLARIELLPDDMAKLNDSALRNEIKKRFLEIGYKYVSLDLSGFRSGSLNDAL